jgi:ADP-ribose pyrophosphatase YjhB (NUDIX family)
MNPLIHKAFAYITDHGCLLLFRHVDDPAAGIQVPAGTIKPGEAPAAAALREAREETGLDGLTLVSCLGEQLRDMTDFGKPETHHRSFYHLACTQPPPATWQHDEPDAADAPGERPRFAFFWAALPDGIPPLIAGHDALLPVLLHRLHADPNPDTDPDPQAS